MTKQEFLAFSLPYGLKMCYEYKDRIDIHILLPMHFDCKFQLVNERGKPILHQLSDLTNPIEHNGEKFVPINEIVSHSLSYYDDKEDALISIYNYPEQMRWWTVQMLIEWHFDIAGLIEKNEAIDINTLTENPYK